MIELKLLANPKVVASHTGLLCLLILAGCRERNKVDTRPRVDGKVVTPIQTECALYGAWRGLPLSRRRLLFRYEDADETRFLLHPAFDDPDTDVPVYWIYRYDIVSNRFKPVPGESWQRAAGKSHSLVFEHLSPQSAVGVSGKTAGKTTLAYLASPQGRLASVISMTDTGIRRTGFFGGPGSPNGPYYHQFFSLPDLKPLGEVVKLSYATVRVCWTPDERFVIYGGLCVIPVNALGE